MVRTKRQVYTPIRTASPYYLSYRNCRAMCPRPLRAISVQHHLEIPAKTGPG